MRNFIDIINEAISTGLEDNTVEEAMWWVQRWIAGSIDDDEWETDWLTEVHDFESALNIVKQRIGRSKAAGKILWRFLDMTKESAEEMVRDKILKPHKIPYQSFSTTRKVAVELADEGFLSTPVLVSARFSSQDIMFSASDFPKGYMREYLADWAHQREVLVRIDSPIVLLSAEIIPYSAAW